MSVKKKRRDVDRGWAWIVLIAVYCGKIILSTQLYMAGVFYVAIVDYYHGDVAITSMIGSLSSGLMCLCGPFVSILIASYSCRVCLVLGGILISLSYFVSAFIDNMNYLILTLGVCGGIANSIASIPMSVTLGYYFQERRNTVISLSMAVIGLAMFIASPLSLYLLHSYGLKGTFMIVGGLSAHLCICGVICKPSDAEIALQKERNAIKIKETMLRQRTNTLIPSNKLKGVLNSFNINLFKNISFMLFLLSTITWNIMQSVCLMHLPNYIVTKGFPESSITLIMTVFGVSNTVGRFLSALTVGAGGIDSLTLHVGTLGVAGVVTLTFPLYSHYDSAGYIYAAVAGFYTGAPNTVMTPITLRLVGVQDISSAHGLEIFFCGIGILAGPPIAASLYETTKSYESSFMMSGLVVLVGSILGILASIKAPLAPSEDKLEDKTYYITSNDEREEGEAASLPDAHAHASICLETESLKKESE
ncbi:monocarboxylate transporter 9-like isoform X2 [Mercenaria mercenaria]|uniref:monocarboxylate transporter 9-like isoform X2 n=1 Tax=Mercenaria mercenaria TaxID=6596 RepID=UPI00234E7A4B|nr:monocarboxylate transporter 9-like isoform X2 [Mercenaria mercenaria]